MRAIAQRAPVRAKVAAYLKRHPKAEVGPYELNKAIGGASPGTVRLALRKLTEMGVAIQTNDQPARWKARPVRGAREATRRVRR